MKKFLITLLTILISFPAFANQPEKWQLSFQEPASQTMRDIVWFHDYMLLPIIVAIIAAIIFGLPSVRINPELSKKMAGNIIAGNIAEGT